MGGIDRSWRLGYGESNALERRTVEKDFDVFVNPSPGNFEVNYLGRDALVKNKLASGRDKDRADVKSLTGRRPSTG